MLLELADHRGDVDAAIGILARGEHPRYGAVIDRLRASGRDDEVLGWTDGARRERGISDRLAALVEIALGEGDLGAAWAAAHEFGPGHRWRELAEASRETMPREAADLHRPGIEQDLRHSNTDLYPGIADQLVVMRDLYARAGADADFTAYVDDIRARFGRRPSLMAALDRRRL